VAQSRAAPKQALADMRTRFRAEVRTVNEHDSSHDGVAIIGMGRSRGRNHRRTVGQFDRW
jgi:hypothetical protein